MLNELTRCDCTTRNAAKARALARRMDELEARIAELRAQEELRRHPARPDGRSWPAGSGPAAVGEALATCWSCADEGPLGQRRRAGASLLVGPLQAEPSKARRPSLRAGARPGRRRWIRSPGA